MFGGPLIPLPTPPPLVCVGLVHLTVPHPPTFIEIGYRSGNEMRPHYRRFAQANPVPRQKILDWSVQVWNPIIQQL